MFGTKKLKDLTEEDIRKYAASLAGGGTPYEAEVGNSVEQPGTLFEPFEAQPPGASELNHRSLALEESSELEALNERTDRSGHHGDSDPDDAVAVEGRRLELARREREVEQQRRRKQQTDMEAERQQRLAEEEQSRLQVLADLERSQMPAVQTGDGSLQKAIEHYTFADSPEVAAISIDLNKDLFEGAAEYISDQNVEVCTRETEVTICLHRVPACKTVAALADWRLHISPLFHSVEPGETAWKIRKGKVSVKLKKRKAQEWRRLVKF